MKNLWIVANWKSNKTIKEALEWIAEVGPKLPKDENLKVVVCPTFSSLSEVKTAVMVGNFPIIVGSQDLSPFPIGSYTGEEPATNLKELISLSIIGHSERRQHFSETDEMVKKKVEQTNENGITALVCVQGAETKVPMGCKLIAYEPIFAIGTDKPDTPANADLVAQSLKKSHGEELEILYGGSVTSDNCQAFTKQDNINGLLIGRASLEASEFVKIVNNCLNQ